MSNENLRLKQSVERNFALKETKLSAFIRKKILRLF